MSKQEQEEDVLNSTQAERFRGTYELPHMSDFERQQWELKQSKKKWVGGHFQRHFGVATTNKNERRGSQLGGSAYPEKVKDGTAEDVMAENWLVIRKTEKSKHVSSKPWYPSVPAKAIYSRK